MLTSQLEWPQFSEGAISKTVMEQDIGSRPVRQGHSWRSDRKADSGNACHLGFLPLPLSSIQLSAHGMELLESRGVASLSKHPIDTLRGVLYKSLGSWSS